MYALGIAISWLILAAIHALPATASVWPGALERVYGVSSHGDVGVLLTHRAALFGALSAGCGLAAAMPDARPVSAVVVGLSMVSFLIVYAKGGAPAGPLRRIAWVDAVGLLPWGIVAYDSACSFGG